MPWSDAEDKQMLFGLIQLFAPKHSDFQQVAAEMAPGITAAACSARLRRMKEEFERAGNGKVKTPVKKSAATPRKSGGGKRKTLKQATTSENGESADQDDDEESPLKKHKTNLKETKDETLKSENKPEDDEDEWLV